MDEYNNSEKAHSYAQRMGFPVFPNANPQQGLSAFPGVSQSYPPYPVDNKPTYPPQPAPYPNPDYPTETNQHSYPPPNPTQFYPPSAPTGSNYPPLAGPSSSYPPPFNYEGGQSNPGFLGAPHQPPYGQMPMPAPAVAPYPQARPPQLNPNPPVTITVESVPQQQPQQPVVVTSTSHVVVVPHLACSNCRVGQLDRKYTVCGIICAIIFFPLGILCCCLCAKRKCTNCGAVF